MKTLLIILCLVLWTCKKDKETSGNVTFYQRDYLERSQHLWIDGKVIDVLNSTYYLDSVNDYRPDCGNYAFPYIVTINLPYGTHTYWLRRNFKNSDTFTLTVSEGCKIVKVPK